VTEQPVSARPVGVRPADNRSGLLRWAERGDLALEVGDQVVVRDAHGEWLAVVAVAAARIVEAPPLGDLPRIVRRAIPAEWPASPPRAGLALLRSLDLPD
jgi:hypothetical protein